MAYFVLGKRKSDFVNAQGQRVQGFNYWLSEPIDSKYGEGVIVNKYWFDNDSEVKFEDIQINKKCEVVFNSKGKPQKLIF